MKSSGFLSENANDMAASALNNAIEYMKTDEYRKNRDATDIIPTHANNVKSPADEVPAEPTDELHSWREARLAELKRATNATRQSNNFPEITEKEFFNGVIQREGGNRWVVLHLFKDSFQTCQIVNRLLQNIAATHGRVTFARVDAEKAPFLVQKFAINVLPALLFFSEETCIDGIVGLDDLGGVNITEDQLREVIASRFEP